MITIKNAVCICSLVVVTFLMSCQPEKNETVDVSHIKIDAEYERFDVAFYTTPPKDLNKLKETYPFLFPSFNPDSVWVNKMTNKDEQELFGYTQEVFKDFENTKKELNLVFKHIKYYYPNFKSPKIISLLSNVDFDNRVVLADSLLFVSLDVFLGSEHQAYADFPKYIKQSFNPENLPVEVAKSYAKAIVPKVLDQQFISKLIYQGKIMALTQAFASNSNDYAVMGYTKDQWDWAQENEAEIWKYFVQNELLFNSDKQLDQRFIEDAPFSKFYLELDQHSPGRIGAWMGWQMIKAFQRNNDVPLQTLMNMNNEELYQQSKYKPLKR